MKHIKCMKKAFTLAEVLISLAVIGVIAALTIPSLINSYKTKIYGSQLKKVYSQLTTAAKEIITDEHADSPLVNDNGEEDETKKGFYYTSAGTEDGVADFLNNYLKNSKKDCGTGKTKTCLASSYKSKDGEDIGSVTDDYYCVQTINGASVCIVFDDKYAWDHNTGPQDYMGATRLVVDVNGIKKPNKAGMDLFVMKIDNNGNIEDLDDGDNGEARAIGALEEACAGHLKTFIENGWK